MGYEIKLIIGKASLENEELERDLELKFSDGSGHPYKRDEHGLTVKTGRKEHYFMVFGILDLCKLGYQQDAFNALIAKSFATAKDEWPREFYYWYGDGDGDNSITEDRYGSHFWPVPVADVLAALKDSCKAGEYRRTDWAMALLESMAGGEDGIEVLFFGH